ncbi:MAG: metallophosphoesterase [archaeon]
MADKKLKILAAGDIHGDTKQVSKLAKQAMDEKVDLVILTGDLTMGESSTKNLIGPFIKAGKEVLLIPGNHETVATADFLAEVYPNTKNLHGYSIIKGDIGIFGAGTANIGIFRTDDKEMFSLLEQGNNRLKDIKKKIMVTHVHPSGTKMEKFTQFFEGSKAVTKAIKKFQPDIALCSHVHEAEGIEEKIGKTKIINVGRKGKIIEI